MLRKVKWNLITIVLIIIFVSVWVGIKESESDKPLPDINRSRIELSALPENLNQALKTIEKRAARKQQGLDKKIFNLNLVNRLRGQTITSSTPLVLQTYYDNSKLERVTSMPSSFVGLTVEQLSSVLEEWKIKQYRPDKVLVMYRTISGLSPEEKKFQHLGIKDGKVAIFYGKKGKDCLKQLTNIKVADLSTREKNALKEGILVSSEEELLTILEGLMSSINRD